MMQRLHSTSRALVTAASLDFAARQCVRCFGSSRPALSMEEFFPTKMKEGETEPKSGRSWTAAELRLKSFDDLHKLWFVCLKERNMLLSDRLYFFQVGQAVPDPDRLQKVRKTMARVKVVLWERARAQAAFEADTARLARMSTGARDKEAAVRTVLEAGGVTSSISSLPPTAAAGSRASRTKAVMVTFKRFGRKHTAPDGSPGIPSAPTRQQKRVAWKTQTFFRNLKARTADAVGRQAAMGAALAAKGQAVEWPSAAAAASAVQSEASASRAAAAGAARAAQKQRAPSASAPLA